MTTVDDYAERGRSLWDGAQVELARGDTVQASEKLWGSAAQAVKAVGEARGWRHGSHRDLYDIIGRLQNEAGNGRLRELFAIASALHQNFYEEWMPIEQVRQAAGNILELRDALSPLDDSNDA